MFETRPIRALISWTAIINGKEKSDAQSMPNPNLAPAIEYVAMADGSLSDAPVIKPGPSDFQNFFSLGGIQLILLIISRKIYKQSSLLTYTISTLSREC